MIDCGVQDSSLAGAIKLYKALSKKLASPLLSKSERRRLVEQRRCILEVFGPEVRLDLDTLKPTRWSPQGKTVTVNAPSPGAIVVLVGEGSTANSTFFIPFDKFASGERKKHALFRHPEYAYAYVPPGDFDRDVDYDKLAEALSSAVLRTKKKKV